MAAYKRAVPVHAHSQTIAESTLPGKPPCRRSRRCRFDLATSCPVKAARGISTVSGLAESISIQAFCASGVFPASRGRHQSRCRETSLRSSRALRAGSNNLIYITRAETRQQRRRVRIDAAPRARAPWCRQDTRKCVGRDRRRRLRAHERLFAWGARAAGSFFLGLATQLRSQSVRRFPLAAVLPVWQIVCSAWRV